MKNIQNFNLNDWNYFALSFTVNGAKGIELVTKLSTRLIFEDKSELEQHWSIPWSDKGMYVITMNFIDYFNYEGLLSGSSSLFSKKPFSNPILIDHNNIHFYSFSVPN